MGNLLEVFVHSFSSASYTLSSDVIPTRFHYYLYDNGLLLNEGEYVGDEIKTAFEHSYDHWRKESVKYSPFLKLKAGDFMIVCLGKGKVIVNYPFNDGQWLQVSKISFPLCSSLFSIIEKTRQINEMMKMI